MSTNYIGKTSLARFLEKLYETFSKKGHAHSKMDILDFPAIPTKVSELTNDKEYLTSVPAEYVTETEMQNYAQPKGNYLTSVPSEYITESELNAKGYLTSYTETDPTVPAWAKEPTKPTYTAIEVGALPADTVIPSIDGLATEEYVDEAINNIILSATSDSDGNVVLTISGV